MEIGVNWAAVGLATVSSFLVGFIWYAKPVFGGAWMKLTGLTEKQLKEGPGGRAWVITTVAAFLEAYVLYHVTYLSDYFYTDASWLQSALTSAIFMWLGFQLSMIFTHDSFEQRRIKLSLINAGHQLTTLLVMGLIIGLM